MITNIIINRHYHLHRLPPHHKISSVHTCEYISCDLFSEAEYAYKLRKCVVPLRLEPGYVPNGWLGIIVGTRLYFDFTSERNYDHLIQSLVKELGSRGRLFDTVDGKEGI